MTNEQKAKELYHEFEDATICGSPLSRGSVAFQASMEMAEWKEQQMIEWLEKHAGTYQRFDITENRFFYNYTEMVNDFKRAMKGE